MKISGQKKGLTLIELLLAVTITGLTVGVVLNMVSQLRTSFSIVGNQSRKEGWQSLYDQAALSGIDPGQVLFFRDFGSPVGNVALSMPNFSSQSVSDTNGRAGDVEVSRLVLQHHSTLDIRPVGFGFQLGQSTAVVPPRTEPIAPLPPTTLPPPITWPTPFSLISFADVSAVPGGPSTVALRSTAPSGFRAGLQISSPLTTQVTQDSVATTNVTVVDLTSGLTARAWTEYPGDPLTDTPVVMADGRTRWFVPSGAALQAYEPSPFISYNFRLSIGRPVLSHIGSEYNSGVQIGIDWYDREAIERGAIITSTGLPAGSSVDWPASTRSHFGPSWPAPGMFWQTEFNSALTGPSSGDLAGFFSSSSLPAWQNVSWIAVRPLLSGWLVSDFYDPFTQQEYTYGWQFLLTPVTLGTPSLSTAPSLVLGNLPTFAPSGGNVNLNIGAPTEATNGKPYSLTNLRLGNPRVNLSSDPFNHWTQSTGPDVSVSLAP